MEEQLNTYDMILGFCTVCLAVYLDLKPSVQAACTPVL